MARFLYPDRPLFLRKAGHWFLAFFWIAGLLCGISALLSAPVFFIPLVRSFSSGTMSIVSVLCAAILPFLVSVFLLLLDRPIWLLLFAFIKAFLFSFLSLGILLYYGSSGWISQCFLLFCDIATVPLLYFLCQRSMVRNVYFCWYETAFVFALVILAGSLDFCIISPFWASLIDF